MIEADVDVVVRFLKDEVARLRAELAAAHESERRLWRAYAMAKGAAERLIGAVGVAKAQAGGDSLCSEAIDALDSQMDAAGGDLCESEQLAGVAVEG